ncbi:Histone H4, partial [Stegodyphus mimosarum]
MPLTAEPSTSSQRIFGYKKKGCRKVHANTLKKISKYQIRRLARRGGVKRISEGIYDLVRSILKSYLSSLIHDSILYADHCKRNIINASDVVFAMQKRSKTLYGFGEPLEKLQERINDPEDDADMCEFQEILTNLTDTGEVSECATLTLDSIQESSEVATNDEHVSEFQSVLDDFPLILDSFDSDFSLSPSLLCNTGEST